MDLPPDVDLTLGSPAFEIDHHTTHVVNGNSEKLSLIDGSVVLRKTPLEVECVDCVKCGHRNRIQKGVMSNQVITVAEDGVFLTWEDLSVTVSSLNRPILVSSTGYAEPGHVLAIMGPSGSGKTTLLDALAGRLPTKIRQSGRILVNGRKQALAFGTSAYVTQDDILMTTLTVREAVYYSAQLQLPDSMSNSDKRKRADEVISEMGLQGSMNTRIGNEYARGLSGGEKRRVSICHEILKRPWLLFVDEPTSGLDSAASFHVMNRLARLARQGWRTVVVSIHQPSFEVFDLFDTLCLITHGKTVYFGPSKAAGGFFEKNGFPCPALMNPADHYLKTINKDFEQENEEVCPIIGINITEAIDVLVTSYMDTDHRRTVNKRVSDINLLKGTKLKNGCQSGFINQCAILTKRSMVNMHRDVGYYWLRFSIYLTIAFSLGTVFYQLNMNFASILDRGSVLMFIGGFLTFMTIGGFPSFVEDMKIFGRERLNGHYGVGAYVIANTLASAPFLALVSIIPGLIAYYMTGLRPGIDHFICFFLILYACMFLVESLMMMIASVIPNFILGIITGAGIQGLMMLTGGYFRLPDDIPKPVLRYPIHFISFHKYVDQGFYKNEFIGLTFPNRAGYTPSTITGMEIVRDEYEMQVWYSKWVDVGILFGMVIIYRFMFFFIIKIREKFTPMMIRTVKAVNVKTKTPA